MRRDPAELRNRESMGHGELRYRIHGRIVPRAPRSLYPLLSGGELERR
jgi:hypothetical protein